MYEKDKHNISEMSSKRSAIKEFIRNLRETKDEDCGRFLSPSSYDRKIIDMHGKEDIDAVSAWWKPDDDTFSAGKRLKKDTSKIGAVAGDQEPLKEPVKAPFGKKITPRQGKRRADKITEDVADVQEVYAAEFWDLLAEIDQYFDTIEKAGFPSILEIKEWVWQLRNLRDNLLSNLPTAPEQVSEAFDGSTIALKDGSVVTVSQTDKKYIDRLFRGGKNAALYNTMLKNKKEFMAVLDLAKTIKEECESKEAKKERIRNALKNGDDGYGINTVMTNKPDGK